MKVVLAFIGCLLVGPAFAQDVRGGGSSGGGGAVSSVSNSDGTLTCSPTTGSVVCSIANPVILPITITPPQAANASVPGLNLTDSTAATSGNQRFSPGLVLTGQGWGTTAPGSQSVNWRIDNEPIQGSTAPDGVLTFGYQVNGGSYTTYLKIDPANSSIYLNGSVINNIDAGAGNQLYLNGTNAQLIAAIGTIVTENGMVLSNGKGLQAALANGASSGDTFLSRPAAANWQFGAADAAAPVPQGTSVQNVTGVNNTAGVLWSRLGSKGTGSGVGGSVCDSTAPPGAAAGTQNTEVIQLCELGSGGVQVGGNGLTEVSGELGLIKIAASGSAPGAAGAKLDLVCGTNTGSAKLIAYAGTSTTPVTIIDNIGSGVTGC